MKIKKTKPFPIERRITVESEIELREDQGNTPTIRGYAALFGKLSDNLGGFREKIAPGAFAEVLQNDVRATIDHAGGLHTLGRTRSGTLELKENTKGLYYEVAPPDTQAGRDIVTLIRRGDISQSSFAFNVAEGGDEWKEKDGNVVRTVRKIAKLFDVSPVTYPAYPDTSVAVRSLELWAKEISDTEAEGLAIINRSKARARALELLEASL